MRRWRKFGLVLAAGTMLAGLGAVGPAQAAQPGALAGAAAFDGAFRVQLISLECWSTEDNLGADEAYLKFRGFRVWGVQSMNDEDTVSLAGDPRLSALRFDNTAAVWLYDADTGIFDKDDWLGGVTVSAAQAGAGEQTGWFDYDGALYLLTYRVVRA
jgi:hypothetical protein